MEGAEIVEIKDAPRWLKLKRYFFKKAPFFYFFM